MYLNRNLLESGSIQSHRKELWVAVQSETYREKEAGTRKLYYIKKAGWLL